MHVVGTVPWCASRVSGVPERPYVPIDVIMPSRTFSRLVNSKSPAVLTVLFNIVTFCHFVLIFFTKMFQTYHRNYQYDDKRRSIDNIIEGFRQLESKLSKSKSLVDKFSNLRD